MQNEKEAINKWCQILQNQNKHLINQIKKSEGKLLATQSCISPYFDVVHYKTAFEIQHSSSSTHKESDLYRIHKCDSMIDLNNRQVILSRECVNFNMKSMPDFLYSCDAALLMNEETKHNTTSDKNQNYLITSYFNIHPGLSSGFKADFLPKTSKF